MGKMQGRWPRAVAVAVLLAILGCTNDGGTADPGGGASSETPAASDTTGAAVGNVAADDRLRLERALGHHAMLVIDAMRHAADDSPRAGVARRAVERNTAELSAAAAQVLGLDVDDVAEVWVERTGALLVLAEDEEQGADDLAAAQQDYGSLVGEALGDRLTAEEATEQLLGLDEVLLEQLTAYRNEQLPDAFVAQREAFSESVRLGQQLVIAAESAPEITSGAVELRSALQQLLGEHAALAVMTTRHAARGSDQTGTAGNALNGNSEDITAALLSIYGERAAVALDEAWRDAISAAVDGAVAAAELDEDARRQARRSLRDAVADVADATAAMTEDTITRSQARRRFAGFFRLLGRHSSAAANGRWRPAAKLGERVYEAGSDLGVLLGAGIAEHRPDAFPQG